jgi:Na+:H+ antiporter, NhaC family
MTLKSPRTATLLQSIIPVLIMILSLGINVLLFDGSPHIPLIGGAVVAAIMGLYLGYSWKELEQGLVKGITIALQACLILMIVGMLIGTWIASGIVPVMIHYGLQLLSPTYFLLATCLICSLVSLSTGSSWSTAGTVGIALIGVGNGLGIPAHITAGAIISGAYFGDKMSPLSDTTNLAPAVAGTDTFTHIRHMVYTTVPSLIIALILYTVIGFRYSQDNLQLETIRLILTTIESHFVVTPFLLIPPALVIAMVIFRIPALPALLGGAFLGGLLAVFVQNVPLKEILDIAQNGFVADTGVIAVDDLLSRGGMESMLSTVALVMCALSFGGVMERTGMLSVLAGTILKFAKSRGQLVTSTIATTMTMNVIAPDQYLSIVVPGRMYREAFERKGLAAKNLSRCLEDGGTITSPLIPWNTCGAYMWVTLGVYPFAYLPFAFMNLINPLVSIFYGFTGLTMHKIASDAKTFKSS